MRYAVLLVFITVILLLSALLAFPAKATATQPVIVAVVGTGGVQADVAYFNGRVIPGFGPNFGQTDSNGHDSGVASVIFGQNPGARVMPVVRDWCAGVDYAVQNGAKVIAIVMISYFRIPCLEQSIARAVQADVLVLAGVGNDGTERTTGIYPADYAGVWGVGSVDYTNWRPSWATVGPSTDVVGYGHLVNIINRDGSWTSASGSSYSTANVAGVASKLRMQYPCYNVQQIKSLLLSRAVDLGAPGKDWWFGNGLVK